MSQRTTISAEGSNKVRALAEAVNAGDLAAARPLLADNLRFIGVFGPPLEGADAYLAAITRLGGQQKVIHCIAEGKDVVCLDERSVPSRPDLALIACGWLAFRKDLIASLRVVVDSMPIGKG